MAKRKNSKKQSQGVIYLIVLACLALICREPIAHALQDKLPVIKERITQKATPAITGSPLLPAPLKNVPEQILHRKGYITSYNREHKIPNWVAWELTPEKLIERESRTDKFLPDPEVAHPVTTEDYKRSGYDRGHLCPAADNKWDEQAMRESFYMTNVCPQDHNLNRGDWKELEEACRDWTMENGRLYVVAGPVLYRGQHRHIGQSRVTVPEAFYKVVFCPEPLKAIGFIYKNKSGNRPLDAYVNSVDEVERITGIDFFPSLPDSVEEAVEAVYDLEEWQMPER